MGYNPNDYEIVKERKARFYADHPDGRIIANHINPESVLDYAEFEVSVYLTGEDQKNGLPKSTGYALEIRDKTLSVSNRGAEYESVNYTSWLENCEESAVGRALDNAGYSSNKKCSREEMEKVHRMKETLSKQQPVSDADDSIPFDFNSSPPPHEEYENPDVMRSIKSGPIISGPQAKRLYAIAMNAGWSTSYLENYLLKKYGISRTTEVQRDDYNEICSYIENNRVQK